MAKGKVTIDGDKGIYTQEEVVVLLESIGLTVAVSGPDGKISEPVVEGSADGAGEGSDGAQGSADGAGEGSQG